jgi:sugar phosphate isomerase/epimerase
MSKIPMALQVYSVRQDAERDLAGTLQAIGHAGYDGVEFAGFYGHSAAEVRRMADDAGLRIVGNHTRYDDLQPDKLADTIAYHKVLGSICMIVPSMPPEYRASRAAWLRTAAWFNDLAKKLAPEGFFTGYHNHAVEFLPLEGELPWETLFANTDHAVTMQLDIGNAMLDGGDPMPFLSRYPGRSRTVHLKEYSPTIKGPIIGEGVVDWQEVFRLAESVGGVEWYIVENEGDPTVIPALERIRRCREALKAMGK